MGVWEYGSVEIIICKLIIALSVRRLALSVELLHPQNA
jgi:hypothetical protein